MEGINTADNFLKILESQGKQFQKYLQNILNPNQTDKPTHKQIYAFLCDLLESNITQQTILKIAKFIMTLVMLGHLHILNEIINYLLPTLISLSSSVHRLSPLDPARDRNKVIEPNKWKNQLACQFIHLMATWFPNNLFDLSEQSKFVRVIKSKKVIIKAYFILNSKFLASVEQQVNKLEQQVRNKGNGIQSNSCEECQKLIQKQAKKKLQKVLNLKQKQNNKAVVEAFQNKNDAKQVQKQSKRNKNNNNSNGRHIQKQNKSNISFFNDLSLCSQSLALQYDEVDHRIRTTMKQKSRKISKQIKQISQKLLQQLNQNDDLIQQNKDLIEL